MEAGLELPRVIGCLAPQAASGLQVLAMVGFVLAARALGDRGGDRGVSGDAPRHGDRALFG